MLKPGDTIAGCTIIAECGRGAYGCVYLAKDVLGRSVAVKLLTSISSGEYELKGLRNYIKLVQPCEALIQIYHCGRENELVFYVMEAADNASENPNEYQPDTLALRLKRNNGRLPAETMLPICHKLLDGLEVLHNSGLVHRDIKPENVIFVNGCPKLADPGLVRNMEQTLSVAGSPGYIAPEYFSGKAPLSPALDIYALGKLLYHCVTGCNPADFPLLPDDMPPELLFQVCHPLLRLCNDSLEQRCKTVAECREVLPRQLASRNAFQRFRDALYVQPKFRACVLRCVIAFVVALFILLGAGLYGRRIMHQRQQALEAQLMRLSDEMQQMQEASSVLDMQLASLNTPSIGNLLEKAKSLLEAKDANAAETELNAVKDKLRTLATESIPAKLDDFQGCAQGWSFLASPLASKYLPQKAQQDFKAKLQHSSSKLAGSAGPKLGSDFTQATYGIGTAVFIAPGMFFSPVLKTQRTISYPYWIYNKEISGDQFYKTTFFLYRRNAPFQAAEYLAWNEALYFCWKANQILQKAAFLPEGYGVRPPTDEEWEYAALGGWEGKCAKDAPKIKNGANQSPGQGEPNALGLWNMEDNLSEIVLPYKE